MKFVGMIRGELKILDNIEPAQLEELGGDFVWVDVDHVDSAAELALKKAYGVKSISESGYPSISRDEGYDSVLLNYFEELTKKELLVMMSGDFIITVHQGLDSVTEETMASLNEMVVSGSFNSSTILKRLLTSVVDRQGTHLRALQASLRNVNLQLKKGVKDTGHIFQLNNDSKEIHRVFYDTRTQISDIVLKVVPVRGLKDPASLLDLYIRMNKLSRGADDFSRIVDEYTNGVLEFLWDNMNFVKGLAVGIASLAMAVAAVALLYVLFPNGLFGIDIVYIFIAVVTLGVIGAIAAQKKSRLRLP